MNDLILFFSCIIVVEVFIRFNLIFKLSSLKKVFIQIIRFIPSKKISDHWKELAIKSYAFFLIQSSFKILLILSFIFFVLISPSYLIEGYMIYLLSLRGIIESALFILIYTKIRKIIYIND
mgnify:CR=1 FL=1